MATRVREKTKIRREEKDTRPSATARYIRMSSRKAKLVIDLIRGKKVGEALAILNHLPQTAARVVLKLLQSAIANAENNMELSADNLFVAEVFANQGPTLKRMMPRAQGRGYRIRKRSCHITIILDEFTAKA